MHWDKLKHLKPPADVTSEEYWIGTKLARQSLLKPLPFQDTQGNPFRFGMPDNVLRLVHQIDQQAGGYLPTRYPLPLPQERDVYLIRSLIEEAVHSSLLEGAATTYRVAKDMLRQGRKPRNRSERMVSNNFEAMQFIRQHLEEELTPHLILSLHRMVTEGTLDHPDAAGKLRTPEDDIHIVDVYSQLLHTPPAAAELPERLSHLCAFANDTDENNFIHPVIRAIVLHFMLGYDHPFVDGNGRTARALFYWAVSRQGYWLLEFTSISQIIKKAPAQYARAFLHTETDENDTTYFLIHQLEMIHQAIHSLHEYLQTKATELRLTEELLTRSRLKGDLNQRQLDLLRYALKHPDKIYTIQEHQTLHGVSYETARTDLLHLADDLQLLQKHKVGKGFVFIVPQDFQTRFEGNST